MRTLDVVVGAQFGSEAKGHVVQRLTERAQGRGLPTTVVRVAGPNAGHTAYDAQGRRWALRAVPVAAVTGGPAVIGVADGSEVDPPVLLDEIDHLAQAGLLENKILWVSGEATIITDDHKIAEGTGQGNLIHRIGSTGKGVGAARADRLMRKGKRVCDDEELKEALAERGVAVTVPGQRITDYMSTEGHLIIEGTQGFGLGLHAGFYPQCTSSDCRATDFMAMAGVTAWEFRRINIWAVARVFPIRVAGNSGPLRGETSWADLGLPEEHTTVTKKVRRVGHPDWQLVADAVRHNGGSSHVTLAVTMLDQMFPFMSGRHIWEEDTSTTEWLKVREYLLDIERQTDSKIGLVTTGPDTATFIREL